MNLRTEEKEKIEHVLFVLDKSGSMERIRKETLDGVNEQVQELKKSEKGITTFVSLVTFDSEVKFLRWNVPLAEFQDLKEEEYVPDGMTAMLDGVGQSVSRLRNETKNSTNDVSHLVIIVSDGAENASSEYNWNTVAEIISKAKEEHWTVTYMGANQDLSQVTKSLGIDQGNVSTWVTTTDGTNWAYSNMSGCLASYRSLRSSSSALTMDNACFYSNSESTGQPPVNNIS